MNKQNIIAVAIGAVLLVGAAYLLFLKPPAADTVTESAPISPAEITFVNLASQLEPLGFDTSILTDPRFVALVDIHTAILPEPQGRHDPFAPL